MNTNLKQEILNALAASLDCFWNSAMGQMNDRSSNGPVNSYDAVSSICHGFASVSDKLRELAKTPESAVKSDTEQKPLNPSIGVSVNRDKTPKSIDWFTEKVCEARNLWSDRYEVNWLHNLDGTPHPDEFIGNYIRNALLAESKESENTSVCYRILEKGKSGDFETDLKFWLNGQPSEWLLDNVSSMPERYKIEYAYAAPSRPPEVRYADAEALIAHLDSLIDDNGQGGEKWEPAQAAIAGIIAWQRGEFGSKSLFRVVIEELKDIDPIKESEYLQKELDLFLEFVNKHKGGLS